MTHSHYQGVAYKCFIPQQNHHTHNKIILFLFHEHLPPAPLLEVLSRESEPRLLATAHRFSASRHQDRNKPLSPSYSHSPRLSTVAAATNREQ